MRLEPFTICTYPGCFRLIVNTERRCAKHPYPPYMKQRETRASASARGYDGTWRWVRKNYITQHPICESQKRCNGDPTEEVDHILPISNGGARLDPANLQALCGACHKWKTAKFDKKGIIFDSRT